MDLVVTPPDNAAFSGHRYRCALGRSGARVDKREGDGATPVGCFVFRRVLYRADRLPAPRTHLPVAPIAPDDGWCDDPADPLYNKPVRLPYPASHERMWRDDGIYDLVVVIGHNDDPVRPGLGSAVFLHLARADYGPTEGCVALVLPDLLDVLRVVAPADRLCVRPSAA
jgi:L,D-peptidoglycan transpeptidase YkuD (ErfK/YbiS/YcfS/YnhG family)